MQDRTNAPTHALAHLDTPEVKLIDIRVGDQTHKHVQTHITSQWQSQLQLQSQSDTPKVVLIGVRIGDQVRILGGYMRIIALCVVGLARPKVGQRRSR